MGLDDLIPDGKETSGRSSSGGGKSSSKSAEEKAHKVVESSKGKKVYQDKEDWDKVKAVIEEEMDFSFKEVMNMQAERRHEVLHEATYFANTGEWNEWGSDRFAGLICDICDHDCTHDGVLIEGHHFCKGHNAGEVRTALDAFEEGMEPPYRDDGKTGEH